MKKCNEMGDSGFLWFPPLSRQWKLYFFTKQQEIHKSNHKENELSLSLKRGNICADNHFDFWNCGSDVNWKMVIGNEKVIIKWYCHFFVYYLAAFCFVLIE